VLRRRPTDRVGVALSLSKGAAQGLPSRRCPEFIEGCCALGAVGVALSLSKGAAEGLLGAVGVALSAPLSSVEGLSKGAAQGLLGALGKSPN
jgi:hypothetical protein